MKTHNIKTDDKKNNEIVERAQPAFVNRKRKCGAPRGMTQETYARKVTG